MLYLKRKIDSYLAEWKANPTRKPLIVKGPRQAGKTESILRFGNNNYSNVICLNLMTKVTRDSKKVISTLILDMA
ncbi:hypothetical protein [Youngiibacter fragilis]|uniref:ATPase n=1 Tax=Youngiibacter fragilis 232.1 TaxID=994573 RepID=V7I5C1_9CLOT|nr:hypothetical protein [Youngiibacter fragilis]ETA81440.1 hypothetical protein T472_0206445 [Youngiibacter fragilis 232.1]